MKKHINIFSIIFTIMSLIYSAASIKATNIDNIYEQLDRAIDSHEIYVKQKEERIEGLKNRLNATGNSEEKYAITRQLFGEYSVFNNDSAILMLNNCTNIARQLNRKDFEAESYVALIQQYAKSGAFPDGEKYLKQVNRSALTKDMTVEFFLAAGHLYGEMAYYTHDKTLKEEYYDKSINYRDSCYAIMEHNSISYMKERVIQLTNNMELEEAIQLCDKWMNRIQKNTHDYAIMAFYRSEIYRKTHDTEQQKYWLAISALCDVKNAVMDQAALWSLADLLSKDGDLERSNRYIEYSWTCTQQFNTNLRSWLVAPVLSMISTSYKKQLGTVNRHLKILVFFISLLLIGLTAALVYVSKKRKQLADTRNELKKANDHLSHTNHKLHTLNERLSTANARLYESNRVKDEYIGEFLNTCSAYVDKLNNYRVKVNRKLKSNQIAELLKMTDSEHIKDEELKILFQNFDTTFLRLFPTFVEEFNSLLHEDSRITPPQENTLTTDLRIFALIRLGIDESSRIADFLRYSPNSIYNYRARIKNKAICNRDEFEQKVKQIGIMK